MERALGFVGSVFQRFGGAPRPACGDIEGVVQAAAAGLGITAAHGYAALPYLQAGQLRTLLPDYELRARFGKGEVHVFFPHRSGMPPRVRAFVDFLAAHGGDETIDVTSFAP